MSEKLTIDVPPYKLMGLLPRMRNRAFKRAFPTPESLANSTEDPYKKMTQKLKEQEDHMRERENRYYDKAGITPPTPAITHVPGQPAAYSDAGHISFWLSPLVALTTKFTRIGSPSSVYRFIEKLRRYMRPGRPAPCPVARRLRYL